MGNLYIMTTITDRKDAPRYVNLFRENDLHVHFISLGYGTATNEIADYLGLDSKEKTVTISILEEVSWKYDLDGLSITQSLSIAYDNFVITPPAL